jgi:hypothetical protein
MVANNAEEVVMSKCSVYTACTVMLLMLSCSNGGNGGGGSQPPPGTTATKPTFNWGYPRYSEYVDGQHVGKTLYQTDPACIQRLMFYTCDAVDATTPDNDTTNPTMASRALTGSFDSCTSAIENERPSYCMPADVCSPSQQANAWAPGQASVDNLSWQLFIALNWPADPNNPGYPDTSKQLGALDTSGTGHARAVWLDYPTPEDLFGVPPPCPGLTLKTTAKFSDAFLSKEYPPAALGGVVQPGGGVLVDQNQKVVYTDIRVDRTEWEFIVNQNNYWQTGASLAAIPQNLMRDYSVEPGMTMGEFPAALYNNGDPGGPVDIGSMELKAAWKQLTPEEIASGTYYTQSMALYDPRAVGSGQCRQQLMGLVGLHIVYMPAQFGNPEWVWATFEHRLNVPTSEINDGETNFSFYSADCVNTKTLEECAAYNPSTDLPQDFRCCPNLKLYPSAADIPVGTDPVPSQVTRLTNPTVSTILPTQCTEHYVNAITKFFGADNVWKNYFLVSAQWPLRGASTNRPFYAPTYEANLPCLLRNATLETFSVGLEAPGMNGCNASSLGCRICNGDCVDPADAGAACPNGADAVDQFNTATCMGCHGNYAGHNSSFIFTHRPCCVRSDGTLPNTCGTLLHQDVCNANRTCTWVASDPMCG